MAKVKNKRNAGAADRASQKRKAEANKKKLNPFEVHINRQKHQVLGKKSKHDRGLPGVSRAKAVQKRKETLGTEMKLMHKTNTFIDKRIGEKNNELSAEDRMVARFAAERAKQHSRKNIYNLADDEVLTHRGQTLEQIEKFDDPRSDDEDEGGFKGLGDDFVSEGHFGGGVLSNSDKDGAKSHKDLIEQLIAESKKRKAEKQKEKEQTLDLTEKLDSEWKDLQPVVFKRARVEEESVVDKTLEKADKKNEDYDKTMRELRFEKRGTPSDAIKTDEKLEQEEHLRIAQLERERDLRMKGDYESAKTLAPKHRSADDLDDNFALDDEKEFMLAYDKDGKPLVPDHILNDYSVPKSRKTFDDAKSSEDEDEEEDKNDNNEESEDEESEDDDEGSDDDDESDVKQSDKVQIKTKDKPKNEKSILFRDSDGSEEDSDNDSDPKENTVKAKHAKSKDKEVKHQVINDKSSEESESNEDDEETESKVKLNPKTKIVSQSNKIAKNNKKAKSSSEEDSEDSKNNESDDESDDESDEEDISEQKVSKKKNDLAQDSESEEDSSDQEETQTGNQNNVKKNVQKTSKPIKLIGDSDSDEKDEDGDDEDLKPFLGKTTDYETLKQLLSDKTPSQQSTALQKLIKSYDPSLGENNKELLSRLFANLLQYVNDLFSNLKKEKEMMKSFLILDKIAPYFYDIAIINKISSRKFFAELLTEKHNEFKKKPKKIPDLDTLIFFKLVSLLYPTSDFRHPITTPCLTFMSEILTTCKFRNVHSISRGLLVTTFISEYTLLSNRYVPAAINFLRGVLYLSAKTTILNPIQVVPPFRLHRDAKFLILEDDCSKLDSDWRMTPTDLLTDTVSNELKIRTLLNTTLLLKDFFDNCSEMEAQECIFEPHIRLLSRLELELYPKRVASIIEGIIKYMKGTLELKTYTPLSGGKPKPKMLRLYEPDIQEVFTGSKSSKLSREMAERQRLQHKYKKEMKGALREIRRDKAYIASVKIRDKIKSDNIRKDKVKQIYKDASIQQGELNKLKRGK